MKSNFLLPGKLTALSKMIFLHYRVENTFAEEAGKAGFSTEEEMQDYMKEIRKEVRGILICG